MWDPDDDEHGDDPAYGLVPTSDEAWDAALGVLATDEEFQRRRAALEPLALHVVVRDVEELELSAWPDPDAVESVVLAVPCRSVLAEESRVEAYLDAVVTAHDRRPGGPRRELTGHFEALSGRRPGTLRHSQDADRALRGTPSTPTGHFEALPARRPGTSQALPGQRPAECRTTARSAPMRVPPTARSAP